MHTTVCSCVMLPLRHVGDAGPIIKLSCKQTNEILYQSDHVLPLSLSLILSLFLSLFQGHILVAEAWCNLVAHATVCITQQTRILEGNKEYVCSDNDSVRESTHTHTPKKEKRHLEI